MEISDSEKEQARIIKMQEGILRYTDKMIRNIHDDHPDVLLLRRNCNTVLGKIAILSSSIDERIDISGIVAPTVTLFMSIGDVGRREDPNLISLVRARFLVFMWCIYVNNIFNLPKDRRKNETFSEFKQLLDISGKGISVLSKLKGLVGLA